MSQYQPTAEKLYRIQSLALSLTDVNEGEMPRLTGQQNAQKQYIMEVHRRCWRQKTPIKIVNAAPDPEDMDTNFAINVRTPGNSIVAKEVDSKVSVWRIGVSADRDHCSIFTEYPGQADSRAYLQANANGPVGLADDSHRNSQKWRLLEVGSNDDHNTNPNNGNGNNESSTIPKRIDEIPEGTYDIKNIISRSGIVFGKDGLAYQHDQEKECIFILHYQNDTTPYFTLKISGAPFTTFLQEVDGEVWASGGTPTLWYFVKTPAFNSYYLCPKRPGKMRSFSGKWHNRGGKRVYNTAPEVVLGAKDQDNLRQRWWITPV